MKQLKKQLTIKSKAFEVLGELSIVYFIVNFIISIFSENTTVTFINCFLSLLFLGFSIIMLNRIEKKIKYINRIFKNKIQ